MAMSARIIVLGSSLPLLKTNSFGKRGDHGGVGFRDAHINVIFGFMSATKVQEGQQAQEEDKKVSSMSSSCSREPMDKVRKESLFDSFQRQRRQKQGAAAASDQRHFCMVGIASILRSS
jgi:hypothetical protein